MPVGVVPMLAGAGGLPHDAGWAYEMKWDGVRALCHIEDGRVRLHSRNDRDITVAYPELRPLGSASGSRPVLLDGEIVVLGGEGRPSFELLQPRMHVRDAHKAQVLAGQTPVTFLIFDVLHLDGRALLALPYHARRRVLEDLGLRGPAWQTPPAFIGEAGEHVLAASRLQGLEGVIAKRLDAPYRPGARSDAWRKIKNVRRQELVVGGYKPGTAGRAGQLGSLLLGVYTGAGWPTPVTSAPGSTRPRCACWRGGWPRCAAAPRRFTLWYPAGTPAPRCGWSRGWWSRCSSPIGPEPVNSATPRTRGCVTTRTPGRSSVSPDPTKMVLDVEGRQPTLTNVEKRRDTDRSGVPTAEVATGAAGHRGGCCQGRPFSPEGRGGH